MMPTTLRFCVFVYLTLCISDTSDSMNGRGTPCAVNISTSASGNLSAKLAAGANGISTGSVYFHTYSANPGVRTPAAYAIDFTMKFGPFPIYVHAPQNTFPALIATTLAICVAGVWLPYSPLAPSLGLVPPPGVFWGLLVPILCGYCFLTYALRGWLVQRLSID